MQPRPIVWTVAGTDSGGGAGIAADQRAADACEVHLCTVVTAVTAQNSLGVSRVDVLATGSLDAQMAALEHDLPPAAVKTGLLGSAEQIACVARWIDRLRERGPVALVVDPVLAATTGAGFADAAALAAYRALLLPRATLLTPNRREAARLAGMPPDTDVPTLAAALRRLGAGSVCITGGDDASPQGLALDWLDTPQAAGWLALPRVPTPHHHGTGCTFATAAASALARGFVAADAAVIAKMATTQALRQAGPAGAGAGPVRAVAGFMADARLMPQMSWGLSPRFAPFGVAPAAPPLGLYAIVDSAARVAEAVAAGVRTLQLRIKTPDRPDAHWHAGVRQQVRAAVAVCRAAGVLLFVNDHHALAREEGAFGLHLGQEDLLAMDDRQRAALAEAGAPALGISSHSLWELARARSLSPRYIACGPVWPTLTKAMPWHAQGLHNLAWWCAMAGSPVVAIGGILEPAQAREAARAGADGVCVVRGLAPQMAERVAAFSDALQSNGPAATGGAVGWPSPSLPADSS